MKPFVRACPLVALSLNDADRLLRFGAVLPEGQVAVYAEKIDFSRDTASGIVSDDFSLVAVGHLAGLILHSRLA